ncbi:hypothetical protein [Sulfuracidifex metallicus]|uniref:VapB-type antitoxin n=1 Tax=Sulfuracidifex metallicus DSM 6482 = JCM 9184 TaxID=523847 RepID=A0A6A9QKB3_SULME|nr:hypothetical protein [Sulfuracidifex metallicus]MUN29074.1 VapB-type antitoxin [Sulfuracidifex metallicus DSM 6482 = JCM 9184]WOE50416.1 VapB-type antitoxin [Sulfuracidifex metallicus DSM 6482 = JCM 9184]
MGSKTITIEVSEELARLIEKMIQLGIAKSKNEAVNMLIESGRSEVEEKIRKQEEVLKLVDEWVKEGFPYRHLDMSDLRQERTEKSVINSDR